MKVEKPIEYKKYVDLETGETHEVPVINHYNGNKDFEMVFYGHLLDILGDLGNRRIQILKHIIENRVKSENVYIGTIKEIAKKTETAMGTVLETLKLLEDKEMIKRKSGIVYINADLICDGRFKGQIMHTYYQQEELTPEQEKAKLEREIVRKAAELERLKEKKEGIKIAPKNQTGIFDRL
jgi:DNA-binding transcriptional regulator YhcF (GntR family)